MARTIDQILAEQRKLEAELVQARTEQREAVVKEVREKVKAFSITATELKGVLIQRRKRGTGPAAKKSSATVKRAYKKKAAK